MSTFVLVHGAGAQGWHWHPTASALRARGHEVLTPDLPSADPSAGLAEYADAVVAAIGDRADVVLVAHSLAGLTAPLVCARVPVALLVLVAPVVPRPGEPPRDWWDATGQPGAQADLDRAEGRDPGAPFDPAVTFFHDLPPAPRAEAVARLVAQADTPFDEPWPGVWPHVPTRVLLCRGDRVFPPAFLRRVVRERLGLEPEEMDGGHFPMLSRPEDLAGRLERFGEAP